MVLASGIVYTLPDVFISAPDVIIRNRGAFLPVNT